MDGGGKNAKPGTAKMDLFPLEKWLEVEPGFTVTTDLRRCLPANSFWREPTFLKVDEERGEWVYT